MGSVGDAYDNALCESFFAALECELLERRRFASQVEARMACFSFIEGFYNPTRRHSAPGYRSPICYEQEMQTDRQSATPRTVHQIGHVWTAPAAQGNSDADAARSGADMCPAC
jgi:putative transposase